ncbi:chromosomal replication initiator protein DnaA [Helicobacter sp. 13S00401-1]|uniref:chromosomal replication initiator protein DnaA n=1 Tax=Helicobacter sp. 13S00401-1 TaxID=1905758 RepID=UPI000BA64D45|nr:chromosomal replication initiator protein DnaA [Helicobacter sp. 13S00401-1]PAF51829.1 chromosomal replication initiator protein DnaA [Helicobacter sp. 13S00401-1]
MNGDEILKKLKDEISAQDYTRYLSTLKYDESKSSGSIIIFNTPNIFIANWIKQNLLDKMLNIVEMTTKVKAEIKIQVNASKTFTKSKQFSTKATTTSLNEFLTFDEFAVGDSNKIAYNICKGIAMDSDYQYKTILIYGSTGVGKTHLLNAIGNYVTKNKPELKVIFITAEEFLNDYIKRLDTKTMDIFRERYRHCDYLLLDEVAFFNAKEKIQDEFFHTFEQLQKDKKKIIMASNISPAEMIGLQKRLRSRIEGSLINQIIPPEMTTKMDIIKRKCELNKISISEELISYIANHMGSDMRKIEGIIIGAKVYSEMAGQDININMINNALKNINIGSKENITMDSIIQTVCQILNIKPTDLKSKKRLKNIAFARKVCVYILRTLINESMPSIAKKLNMKDHSSISKQMKTIVKEIEENQQTKMVINEIISQIKN